MNDETIDLPPPIVPGVARALSPLVRRIALDVSGAAGANTYLVGIDEIVVIDPGPDVSHHIDSIAGCCGDRLRWILSTGSGDQSGADSLRDRTGAEIIAVDGIGPSGADEKVTAGFNLVGTEFRLTTMTTDTDDGARAMYFLAEERVLFSGDYFADDMTSPIADAKALAETVSSFRRLRLRAVAPFEGQLIEEPMALLTQSVKG